MNVITVFRDPGWSLDVVTNMPNMQWKVECEDMVKKADIIIDGRYVLYLIGSGKERVGSDALKTLTQEVGAKSGNTGLTCCSVWQKCSRLRKIREKLEQDTAMHEPSAAHEPVEAVEAVPHNAHPVTGGKCPMRMAGQRIENYANQARTQTVQVEAQEPVPRPVTGGNGLRFNSGLLLASETTINVFHKLDTLDAQGRKIGSWNDIEIAKVAEWQRDNNTDRSTRSQFTNALMVLADELNRTFRGTFDRVWAIRKNVPAHMPEKVVVPRKIVPNDTAVVANFQPGPGDKVQAKHNGSFSKYDATVISVLDGTYTIAWDDNDPSDTFKTAQDLFRPRQDFKSAPRPPPRVREVSESPDEGSSGDVIPQLPATTEIVVQSTYYDEQEEEEQRPYSKEYEQEVLQFMSIRLRDMSHSKAAAAVEIELLVSGNVEFPGIVVVNLEMPPAKECCMEGIILSESDDEYDSDEFHAGGLYTEEELQQMNTRVAQAADAGSEDDESDEDEAMYVQQMNNDHLQQLQATIQQIKKTSDKILTESLMALIPQHVYETDAAAGSSSGAAATATLARDTMLDNYLIESLAAVAGSRAREMSPSNGAAATGTPAPHALLARGKMDRGYVAEYFNVAEHDFRIVYVEKLEQVLEALRDMEQAGVITFEFDAEHISVFKITRILVIEQTKWQEVMTKTNKHCSNRATKGTKNYQMAVYDFFNNLGFKGGKRNEKAHDAVQATVTTHRHMCFDLWEFDAARFKSKHGRFLGFGHGR